MNLMPDFYEAHKEILKTMLVGPTNVNMAKTYFSKNRCFIYCPMVNYDVYFSCCEEICAIVAMLNVDNVFIQPSPSQV